MTRTSKSPRLLTHVVGPTLAMHPEDMVLCGLEDGRIAQVSTAQGFVHLPVEATLTVRKGDVFANMHWNDQFSGRACIDTLVAGNLDPISGQPELKSVPVTIEPATVRCFGYFLSAERPNLDKLTYWSAHKTDAVWQVNFALSFFPDDLLDWLATSFSNLDSNNVDTLEYVDSSRGDVRCIRVQDKRVLELVFTSTSPVDVSRDWLSGLVTEEIDDIFSVVAGVPVDINTNKGKIVCACEGVGELEIKSALNGNGCATVADLGKTLRAGENCGSCRPELARLVADFGVAVAS